MKEGMKIYMKMLKEKMREEAKFEKLKGKNFQLMKGCNHSLC